MEVFGVFGSICATGARRGWADHRPPQSESQNRLVKRPCSEYLGGGGKKKRGGGGEGMMAIWLVYDLGDHSLYLQEAHLEK